MFKSTTKIFALLITVAVCVCLSVSSPVQSAPEDAVRVKELNFVFLHGVGSHSCSLQLLEDVMVGQLSAHILDYERAHPGTEIKINIFKRCYPSNVDIDTWANNIADSINEHFADRKNLILIGHSMGGKAALYAVAKNTGGLSDKTAMVVTINSPIKSLQNYYFTAGNLMSAFYQTQWLVLDEGVSDSLTFYDSSQDGQRVAKNKHWLAFISAESAPLSEQYNFAGVDALPRNMDDDIVPISAQYSDGADVIYYGEHSHTDYSKEDEVADFLAGQILRYIFGGRIECSVFAGGGSFEHKADWLLGTDNWEDVVGEVLVSSGTVQHKNESFTRWQEWEDAVGDYAAGIIRSSFRVKRASFPVFTSIKESRWLSPDDSENCRLYIRTRAAPKNTVRVEWSVYQQVLLPEGTVRDHYEVEILTGTPLTGIRQVSWETGNPRDLRLRISSEAQSPFRWFKAEWRVYYKEVRERRIIDEIPLETPP